jgi:hypothetical protein
MPRKGHSEEEIVRALRKAEAGEARTGLATGLRATAGSASKLMTAKDRRICYGRSVDEIGEALTTKD